LTAFQIAFQKAQERAGDKKSVTPRGKKTKKGLKDEQEEIFNRTLENRITSNYSMVSINQLKLTG
jgi:hypothetical protein